MKNLIAYFSRKGNNYAGGSIVNLPVGNTEAAAKKIQAITDGDLFEIQTVHSYSEDYTVIFFLLFQESTPAVFAINDLPLTVLLWYVQQMHS